MNKYPITPPPELVQQWKDQWLNGAAQDIDIPTYVATQAANWAANAELDACCEWLSSNDPYEQDYPQLLRAARRPTLKEQALALINRRIGNGFVQMLDQRQADTIRRALEQLPDDPAVTPDLAIESESDVYNNIPVATDEELCDVYDSIPAAHRLSLRAIYDIMNPKIIKILRWPENKQTGLVPWFVILRQLIFWPLLFIGIALTLVALLGGFGIKEANRFWMNNR